MSAPERPPSFRRAEEGSSPRMNANGKILKAPGSGTIKAVSIAEPEESISPLMRGSFKEVDDFDLDRGGPKQHRAKIASARLSGRPSAERLSRSRHGSIELTPDTGYESTASTRPNSFHQAEGLIAHISEWIKQEKARRAATKNRRRRGKRPTRVTEDQADGSAQNLPRRDSDVSSEGSVALDKLQEIIERGFSIADLVPTARRHLPRKMSSRKKLRRTSTAVSSDTENADVDPIVPTCDVILDNSKTLSYSAGFAESEKEDGQRPPLVRVSTSVQKDAWKSFKYEIVRLAHTLRLRAWRRVPMDMSDQIEVERLSGALTNAVYVVSPPKNLPAKTSNTIDGTTSAHPREPPPKLLLRIYGSNVNHLIDRESELQILRRLARKHIGPCLLGTFTNGRFEEFLHARALSAHDLRDPSISKQIAKRMRELHEGIDLLPHERLDGPFVWRNISKWMNRCEQIVSWVDAQSKQSSGAMKQHQFVCGTEWAFFRETVEKYRKWLFEQYGGSEKLRQQLVFAHNDTQYGNILRMVPSGESPLLLPANQHKQLVVIDFEYANANLPGLEFANHFSEWCYNYHDINAPHACNTKLYPNVEEQKRFIRSYLAHRPSFSTSTPAASDYPSGPATPYLPETPSLQPASSSLSTSLISNFMLDSRFPQSRDIEHADEELEAQLDIEVARLMHETRIWRLVNSVQWVMWGVLQAKIPGLPDFEDPTQQAAIAAGPSETSLPGLSEHARKDVVEVQAGTDPLGEEERKMAQDLKDKRPEPEEGEDDEEFDYLGYAFDRAMFFWGDAVGLGIVKKEDLPEDVRNNIKLVEY